MSQTDREEILESGETTFSSDSKLLSEIGERLIATPDIALAELIKNSYDADATKCNIWLEDDRETLVVKDDGHGMTKEEFLNYWMTVATTSRLEQETSKRYNRELTGAKGVGRFAVRNLGLELELSTVAKYDEHDEYRRLTAYFRWADFESGEQLEEENVEYVIEPATESEEGTELRISDLQDSWTQEELEEVSGEVLDIISAPYETNRSLMDQDDEQVDPGFSVYFAPPGEGSPTKSAAQEIYERYVAKISIEIEADKLTYECEYPYGYDEDEAEERTYEFTLDRNLIGDLHGEIRYFNRNYPGVFRGMDKIDGRSAPKWLKENGGIRVIDKNFRVPPYGDQGNDWLNISESHARRERAWRSSFAAALTADDEISDDEVEESQLNLPRKNQVLGALQVSSHRPEHTSVDRGSIDHLVPAMDRQGFVENDAMNQLVDVARGGLEIIAILDREEKLRREQAEAEDAGSELQSEIKETKEQLEEEIDEIVDELDSTTADESVSDADNGTTSTGASENGDSSLGDFVDTGDTDTGSSTQSSVSDAGGVSSEKVREKLTEDIKPEIEESYSELEARVQEYEEAQENLRTSVESMYLMSAVAAFMTHETGELLREADNMIEAWEQVPEEERDEAFESRLETTKEAKEKFNKQLGYAKRFMTGLDEGLQNELFVNGKLDEVIHQFDHYTEERYIEIERNVPQRLKTPELNPSIYTGVIMNLFTNAVKAVLDVPAKDPGRIIRFDAENRDGWHILRVSDTGVGIPEGMEERIFDPLFSTTDISDEGPLGSGVGLGLYVVKRVVERSDGQIEVVEPPEGFETCFEVRFKR
ncbi:sensor histidine kinase [Haloglomus litoreum]|uniref:sensor histidine kinase n=1 Tax=Haloglomus litoreum TaxID=3034026 RepID=UPI0023E80A77|nr:sensor histidine kinase [Haloglomus sp. DT116]